MSNAAWIAINLGSKAAPMNVNTNVSLETEIKSPIWSFEVKVILHRKQVLYFMPYQAKRLTSDKIK